MKLELLNCPACNFTLGETVNPNHPFKCPACGSTIVMTDWTKTGQLICQACDAVNAGFNKFCEACGVVLQVGCPFCYTMNSVAAIHCKKCGANLQRAWQRQTTWLEEKEKHDLERKHALQAAARSQEAYLERLLLQLDDPSNHPTAIPSIRMFGPEAVEALIKLLTNADPDARFGAAIALGEIGDQRALPGLVKALKDPQAPVRYWALDALGKLRAGETVDEIRPLLKDKHPSIKKLAKEIIKILSR